MYRVLLADDEQLDLEGMQTFIPWSELGMQVVDAVNNGFAACRVIEQQRVDILVTDVRMPNMSGIELAKNALEKQKHLRVIFVSGHQDFNYVKQALSLNACSYVLKPMDDEELIQSLKKVRNELDADRKRLQTEKAFKRMVPIVKNEYMLQLLEGTFEQETLELLLSEYRMHEIVWPARISVLEIDDLTWKLNSYGTKEKQKLLAKFFTYAAVLLKEQGIQHLCRMGHHRIAFLLEGGMDISPLGNLLNRIQGPQPFTVTCGLGGCVASMTDLQESYREAVEALDYKMFHGKGKVIEFGEVHAGDMEDARNLEVQLDSLFEAMTRYELVRIHDELEQLFRVTWSLRTKFTVCNFAMYIIMKLDEYLHTLNEDLFRMLGLELKNLDILLHFETVDDILSWLRRRVFELSEMLQQKKRKKNWKLVQDMMEYVESMLHDNVTLRDVADHFSFSPNYLGLLFKEETGQNFSDFVISLRMRKASEMLADHSLKIYEVADKVGYRYLPYFSRQFKEMFGMTPLEYRRSRA
ncbi:response regulator [Marinicrinis lubricantis]|uniref:Response regulator n=1 Tax=Marinicrinis lubricantis TaxID=2086470 RepID=A0ABW1ITS3_9BACL